MPSNSQGRGLVISKMSDIVRDVQSTPSPVSTSPEFKNCVDGHDSFQKHRTKDERAFLLALALPSQPGSFSLSLRFRLTSCRILTFAPPTRSLSPIHRITDTLITNPDWKRGKDYCLQFYKASQVDLFSKPGHEQLAHSSSKLPNTRRRKHSILLSVVKHFMVR
jgi:hypothetical protein